MDAREPGRVGGARGSSRWLIGSVAACLMLVLPTAVRAQDALTVFNPNVGGTVNAVASGNGVTYLGGSFSSVSFDSGSMARLDATTGLPDPNFPQVTGQEVDRIVSDGNGGWYIGGLFTSVSGTTRNSIAHILSNDTLDQNFNPNANGEVYDLNLIGSTLYVSGTFTTIGGASRTHVAALDATTGLATSWSPGTLNGSVVYALATNSTGLYMAGDFTTITPVGGSATARMGFACCSVTNGSLSSWNPNCNGQGYSIQYNSADGNLYCGGNFTSLGGASRNYLAAISTAGVVTSWNPNLNSFVTNMRISNGVLFAAGVFTTVGGASHPYLAAFNVATANAGTPYAWNPNPNSYVICLQPVGNTLYIGGFFTQINGTTRDYLAAVDISNLNTAAPTLTSWAPAASNNVYALATDSTTVLAGGPFTAVQSSRANVVAVNSETGAVLSWNPSITGTVQALALSGTTLFVGGNLTKVGTTAVTNLVAIDTGTGNLLWSPSVNNTVNGLCVVNNTLYAVGAFTSAGGSSRAYGAAWSLSSSPYALASWNPNANNTINALAWSGSDMYLGGNFTQLASYSCSYLGAVDLVSASSSGFNGGCNNTVSALTTTGSLLYAGGSFTQVGSTNRSYAAAWNVPANTLNTSWNPSITGSKVTAIAAYLDDVFLGGTFSKIGTTTISDLASVNPTTGALNTGWFTLGANNPVLCMDANTASPQFRLFIGGSFSSIGSTARANAASFDLDLAPTALALTPLTVTAGSPNGTVIGTFTTTDPNPNDTFTYTLTSSANGLFGISGNQLVIANQSLFTTPPPSTYSITAVSTDADGSTVTASFTLPVTVIKQTPTVTWATPAAITYGTALSATQLDATASVPGTFAYSPASGTVLHGGSQTLTCTFTPQDTTDYSVTNASVTLTVQPAPLTVTANSTSRVFNTPNPTFTASYSGFVNGDTAAQLGGSLSLTTTATQSSPKGTYPITASGLTSTDYTITYVNGTLTIAAAAPVITWNAPASITYGTALSATQLNATASVQGSFVYSPASGTYLHAGTNLTLSSTFTPTDTTDYTSVTTLQYITVTAAPLTVSVVPASMTYGAGTLPTFVPTYATFVAGDTSAKLGGAPQCTTTATGGSIAGSYSIQVSRGGITDSDYTYTFSPGTLTIGPATLTVTPANGSFTYGGTVPTLSAAITGYVNGDSSAVVTGSPALSTTATSSSAVGTYPITAAVGTLKTNANYSFAYVSGVMTVGRATLTVTPSNATKVYGAALPTFADTITGFVNHDTVSVVSGAATFSTTASAASNVGSYALTAGLGTLSASNYSFVVGPAATLTVTPAALTVAATTGSKVYGAALPSPLPYAFTGLVNGDSASVVSGTPAETCTATVNSGVGTSYSCQVTSASGLSATNYTITANTTPASFSVVRAPLIVRAWDCAMVQGSTTMPHLTPAYAGFQLTDTSAVLSGTATCSTTVSASTPIGMYSVTTTGSITAANYSISYGSGSLAVVGKPSRISVSSTGGQLQGSTLLDALSADGSVALVTTDATLPGNAAGNPKLYLFTTSSTPPTITAVPDAICGQGALSGDGTHVAYIAPSGGLFAANSYFQIELWTVGASSATTESTTGGAIANGDCLSPLVSDDGEILAFMTEATNLTGAASNPNGNCDIIYRNRSLATPTDIVISALPAYGGVAAAADCQLCALSADGRYCAFTSTSTTLCGSHSVNATYPYNAYLYDGWYNTLTRIDLTTAGGQPDAGCGYQMSFTTDNKYLVFSSYASNLVTPTLPTQNQNVYLYTIASGPSSLIRISSNENGVLPTMGCYAPQISGDGHYVAFLADDGSFDPSDTNSCTDVYIASLYNSATQTIGAPVAICRQSLTSTSGLVNDDILYELCFSRDATKVAYYTFANNCVTGDTNGDIDVFEQATMVPAGADPPPAVPTPPTGDG